MLLTIQFLTALAFAGIAQAIPAQSPLRSEITLIPSVCDCRDVEFNDAQYICGDPRLGPVELPRKFPLLDIVSSYDRFGGIRPALFLEKWWNSSSSYNYRGVKGSWKYPIKDGFLFGPDNVTVQAYTTLSVGTLLDRFGSEYGQYLAAAEAPFCQRALPPSNLNTGSDPDYPSDYRIYRVIKPFPVLAGVIAPGFGQPGLGAQFYIGAIAPDNKGNVMTAMQLNYIEKVNKTVLTDPGDDSLDPSRRCGLD